MEAELGRLGGAEEDIHVDEKNAFLTDPDEAEKFVKQSGCDSLACAIGTSHGAYKFSGSQGLHFNRISAIQERLPGVPLVMHGSSSVPQEWLAIIREYGGEFDETYGVPVDEIKEGIRNGVRKVNIDTDIRLAMTGAIRRALVKDKSEFDPRKLL